MAVDYSLYLVTDNTPAILGSRDFVTVVKEAVAGGANIMLCFYSSHVLISLVGVTILQLRDKTSETIDLIRNAKKLHEITKAHNIPLLINDRVDVALAVGCEGVHIGQDDIGRRHHRSVTAII